MFETHHAGDEGSSQTLELLEELARRQDREPLAESEEVRIPGHERYSFSSREREEVVILRVS